ncbi:MAG: hypothetical protein IKF37_01325 [Bacilli bacterium]|nr:hypothetical protein [Bacilli bacterium]
MSDKINKINKELKVFINESSFISTKCRNKLLKIFCEVFSVDLDIGNYLNVDLSFTEDFNIMYREDIYKTDIKSMAELEEKYDLFRERASSLIDKTDISFTKKSDSNNIINLLVLLVMLLFIILLIYLVVGAFFSGDYFNCIWILLIVIPSFMPNFKSSFIERINQAKNYLKRKIKK